ncbi:HNH endonuclease [Candidatus Hydrogenedentota bacterium]
MVSSNVLVLNRSWIAVHVADVKRALSLVYQDLAKVVNPEDFSTYDFLSWRELSQNGEGRFINTVNYKIAVPEVIVLNFFNKIHQKTVKFSRRNIFERDKNTCQYCGRRFARTDLTIDHVIPKCNGGTDRWGNVVLACVACNISKGGRTPEQANMPLIRKPRKPSWISHLGFHLDNIPSTSWQKFIDKAYWDVELES